MSGEENEHETENENAKLLVNTEHVIDVHTIEPTEAPQTLFDTPSEEILSHIEVPTMATALGEDESSETPDFLKNSLNLLVPTEEFLKSEEARAFPDPEDFNRRLEKEFEETKRKSVERSRELKEKYAILDPYVYSDIYGDKETEELLNEEETENARVWKCCSIKCLIQ
jgi:hypothetical protein